MNNQDQSWVSIVDRNNFINYLTKKITSVREDIFNRKYVVYLKNYIVKRNIDIDEEQLKAIVYSLLDEVCNKLRKRSTESKKILHYTKMIWKRLESGLLEESWWKKNEPERRSYKLIGILKIIHKFDEATKKTLWTEYANK